jgi:hypothetical protein
MGHGIVEYLSFCFALLSSNLEFPTLEKSRYEVPGGELISIGVFERILTDFGMSSQLRDDALRCKRDDKTDLVHLLLIAYYEYISVLLYMYVQCGGRVCAFPCTSHHAAMYHKSKISA